MKIFIHQNTRSIETNKKFMISSLHVLVFPGKHKRIDYINITKL